MRKRRLNRVGSFITASSGAGLQGGKTNKADQPTSLDTADGDDNDNIDVKYY